MSYNSTIRQKQGICPMCSGTNKQPLIGGMCQRHYWDSRRMKSAQKHQEKELEQDEDLQTLVKDLDIIFSRYIRLKDANVHGLVKCISCETILNIQWLTAATSSRVLICTRALLKIIAGPNASRVTA